MIVSTFAAESQPIPKLKLLYPEPTGTVFDRTCGQLLHTEINPEWVREAVHRLPEFQAAWDRQGPKYLKVVFKEIGLEFPYREMQAVLTVCPVSTMSMPLMINVKSFLSSAEHPSPKDDFAEKVFHELMHHYVSPVMPTSTLRKKYGDESPVVFVHLHVMALEKFVLEKLGKTEELQYLDAEYRTDPPPSYYSRAWEIVNREGYQAFLNELKRLRQ
jgi:hypothetical protein